jgi:hypothetical protein
MCDAYLPGSIGHVLWLLFIAIFACFTLTDVTVLDIANHCQTKPNWNRVPYSFGVVPCIAYLTYFTKKQVSGGSTVRPMNDTFTLDPYQRLTFSIAVVVAADEWFGNDGMSVVSVFRPRASVETGQDVVNVVALSVKGKEREGREECFFFLTS